MVYVKISVRSHGILPYTIFTRVTYLSSAPWPPYIENSYKQFKKPNAVQYNKGINQSAAKIRVELITKLHIYLALNEQPKQTVLNNVNICTTKICTSAIIFLCFSKFVFYLHSATQFLFG